MTETDAKIVQYLNEAHAMEVGLVRVLQEQVTLAPAGEHRTALDHHLQVTRRQEQRLRSRVRAIEGSPSPITLTVGVAETLAAQVLALAKTPLDLLRGTSGAEKVLKNAKDACATEALEIATYTALTTVADDAGDVETSELARSIRAEEQEMLDTLLDQLPELAATAVDGHHHSAPPAQPWPGYDEENARDVERAVRQGDHDLARRVRAYERDHKDRKSVLDAAERETTNA